MNRLKELREEHGMTQERLAQISHVSRNTIAALEADPESEPRFRTAYRIAEAFNRNPTDVFPTDSIRVCTKCGEKRRDVRFFGPIALCPACRDAARARLVDELAKFISVPMSDLMDDHDGRYVLSDLLK